MFKKICAAILSMVLCIGVTAAAFAAPPTWGITKGNTWNNGEEGMDGPFSFSPIPNLSQNGNERFYTIQALDMPVGGTVTLTPPAPSGDIGDTTLLVRSIPLSEIKLVNEMIADPFWADSEPSSVKPKEEYTNNKVTAKVTYTFDKEGIYNFSGNAGELFFFYVFVSGSAGTGGSSAAPTPSTPSTSLPPSSGTLKTTEGLTSVVPPSPTAGQDLYYKVQPGEKVWSIAWNYYDTMLDSAINKIMRANAAYFKQTRNILEAGAVLTLPAQGLKVPVTQSGLSQAAGIYLIKAGDTLAIIAQKYYGDTKQWTKIYEANKDRVRMIGNVPMIYECQWLIIPN